MIIRPTKINAPSHKTLSDIKLACMEICEELRIKFNVKLSSLWKIECLEKDEKSILDLISEKLKEK